MNEAFGWDAAFCPDPPPLEAGGKPMTFNEIYIGGSSAFHVWTAAEVERLDGLGLVQLPVWVPTPGADNPRQAALQAASILHDLGVPAYASPWRVLMWDLETGSPAIYGSWLTAAADTLASRGYGSLSYADLANGVLSLPQRTGRIVAHWDGQPVLESGQLGHQYQPGVSVPGAELLTGRPALVDLNVIDTRLLPHLGRIS